MKVFKNAKMIEGPVEESRKYFDKEMKVDKRFNGILRKFLGIAIIGFYEENLDMEKKVVLEGFNHVMGWLPEPGYKANIEHAQKVLWNYYTIERDIVDLEVRKHF